MSADSFVSPTARLAAVYADLNQLEEAKAAVEKALGQNPKFSVSKRRLLEMFERRRRMPGRA